jgi:hypothetical protein
MLEIIDNTLEKADFNMTWLSKTSHSARVALDGEELPIALELLNKMMLEQVDSTQPMIEHS